MWRARTVFEMFYSEITLERKMCEVMVQGKVLFCAKCSNAKKQTFNDNK